MRVLSMIVLLVASASNGFAQGGAWTPSKPIRFIVAAAQGGTTDLLARVVGPKLADRLGQQVLVENRGGGGGVIASELVAKAAPDGHTLGVFFTANTVQPSLHAKLPFRMPEDFAAITLATRAPLLLVVHPDVPAHTVRELIEHAKRKPLNYASAGNGSGGHLCGELFKQMTGIEATHIPYKGAGPAAADLVAGQTAYQFAAEITVKGFLISNRLRVLAVSGTERAPTLPNVPTVAESGLPGFDVINWFGFVAPGGTPAPVIARLNEEIVLALKEPDVRERLTRDGSEIIGSTVEKFAEFMRQDVAKWARVVKTAGIRAD